MARSSSYAAKNVTAMVNGQRVQGLWDGDDPITVESVDDLGALMVGADGDSIFSQFAGTAHTITLRLQHTSPTHTLLHQRWAVQRAPGVRVTPFPFTHMDVDSGEGGSANECFIMTAPSDQKGRNAVMREWVLVTGEYLPNIPNG